jgi:hypothetical protein
MVGDYYVGLDATVVAPDEGGKEIVGTLISSGANLGGSQEADQQKLWNENAEANMEFDDRALALALKAPRAQ